LFQARIADRKVPKALIGHNYPLADATKRREIMYETI